jgi:type VII secretion-associated serine protease mycosin
VLRWRAVVVATTVLLAVVVAAPAPAMAADTIRQLQRWYLDAVKATQAHLVSRGDGVVVAVIDSGVDAGHPDLSGAVLPGRSFSGAASQAGRTDPQGHGTKMAGVIAARGGGENNALGIAPRARILPVAVPTGGTTGSIGEPIRWAVDNDAKVINLSLGRPGDEPLLPGEAEAIRYAISKDVVVVVDAGNIRQLPTGNALAMVPGVVAVSGTSQGGGFWSGSVDAPYVGLAAPAEDIVNVGARNIHNTGYSSGSGTSESAAIVSGVAALIRAEFPDLDANNVINRLVKTAVDEGPPGRDRQFGFGVVDARRAVTADVDRVSANPLGQGGATPTEGSGPGGNPGNNAGGQSDATGRLLTLVGIAVAVLVGLIILVVIIVVVVRAGRRRPTPVGAYQAGRPPPYQPPPPYPQQQPPPYQQPPYQAPPQQQPPPGYQQPPYQPGFQQPPHQPPPPPPSGWQPPPRP